MPDPSDTNQTETSPEPETRRDFLCLVAGAMGAVGAAGVGWACIGSLNPTADAQGMPPVEVDLAPVAPGMAVTVSWHGQPVFIRHRTAPEIAAAQNADAKTLIDPETDAARVQRPEWLVVVGVCTHLGCIPLGQKTGDPRGAWDGYLCPCHGSEYDTSGRVRQGPAPRNLMVPPYAFLSDTRIRIG